MQANDLRHGILDGTWHGKEIPVQFPKTNFFFCLVCFVFKRRDTASTQTKELCLLLWKKNHDLH